MTHWHRLKPGRKVPGDTALLLYLSDWSISVGRYDSKAEGWICDDTRTKPASVTHWAYIKRPPSHLRNKVKRAWYRFACEVRVTYHNTAWQFWGWVSETAELLIKGAGRND